MPSEPKIARTVAEAEVGDLLWRFNPNANRYDENRKYLGRGVWDVIAVKEIRRQYLSAGGRDYSRSIGAARGNYSSISQVFGAKERAYNWWSGRQHAIANAVHKCGDLDTLKAIAFALGLEGPPDFSVVPTDPTPQKDRADG